jgi:YbgC/YbaW family acyl-CoA thioester hydrolase
MSSRVVCRFPVRHYELDVFGHVNNAVYIQLMQEAAIEASTRAGYGPDWYRQRGTGWVIRRLTVRYLAQVSYGDEIEIATWVSQMRGASCHREYDLKRTSDGLQVARARALWAYVDLGGPQPTRLPPEFSRDFAPTGAVEDLDVRLRRATATPRAHRYHSRRRVQFHELDTSGHVNHAAYLHWVGQAFFDALRVAGYPPERMRREGWAVFQGGHEIEYLAPALDNDEIELVSWVCEMARVRGAWTHEIYNAATGRLLARDYSLGVFVTGEGRPTPLPQEAIDSVVRDGSPGH